MRDRYNSRRLMLLALVCAIAAPLAALLWLCGSVSLVAAFVAMVLASVVILSAGFALLRAVDAQAASPAWAWICGVFATSLALYALVQWLELRATTAAVVWTVLAGGLAWRHGLWRTPIDARQLLGLVLCGAVTLLWCHHSAAAPAVLSRMGLLPVWIDYYIHGGVISGFGDALAHGRQSIDLADFPRPFYHYASYLLPAVFAAPLDLPGLPLATSVWLPLGFFTLCAGAYVFGQTLAGPAGGVGAVAVLTLVPDASDYGLRNAFFGFDWHVLTHPSAAYALGIALASLAFLKRWTEQRSPRLLAASVALAAGLLLFRAHIFLLALPCVLASAAIATAEFRRRRLIYLGVAIALVVAADFALYRLLDQKRALQLFLDTAHHQPAIAYAGWYDALLQRYGTALAVPAGVLLVFPVFLGIFTLLYPVALWLRHRSGRLQAFDAMPALLIVGYALLMALAPIPANGDPTELTQRPFVLVYAVLAIWTVAVFVERLSFRWLLGASGLALAMLWPYSGLWRELPKFEWGWGYYGRPITPGLIDAASFLRRNARPGEQFAAQGLHREWVSMDVATQLAALTGMPAYLARPYVHIAQGGARKVVALQRYAALESVETEPRAATALARLGRLGIRWYVVAGERGPAWDPERRLAAFRDRGVAVYRTTSL
jgi:hypothetical protein